MYPNFELGKASAAAPGPTAAASGAPSNQQIIDAAQAAYKEYQAAVDSMTIALVNSVQDTSLASAIQQMDGTNWSSPGVSSAVAAPVFSSSEVATFSGVARRTSSLQCVSVGVFAKNLPTTSGRPGMIGFVRDLAGSGGDRGLILELDIFSSVVGTSPVNNLQYSLWVKPADQLHDLLTGLFTMTNYQGVALILKLLLTKSLDPYGFAVSSGTTLNLPVSSGVFAGSTSQWSAQ
jgi:hypothetical protein